VKTLLRNLFLSHWERKAIAAILSVIIWLVVNHSLTEAKTFDNVAVRILNLPPGMTVEGIQSNNVLRQRISLTVSGNKTLLEEVTSNDLEVVVDATDKIGEIQFTVSKKNIFSLSPDLDLSKTVMRVVPQRISIELTKMITEKIPVVVGYPIGEAPRDYQFLDIFPYHLYLTVSGPEETVNQLKAKGLNLVFNLSNVSRAQLDAIQASLASGKNDEVNFPVPDDWKKISIPALSDRPFEIDDPQAKFLRIGFIQYELHPIAKSIPVSLFFPPESSVTLNPQIYSMSVGSLVQQFNGLNIIRKPLFAKGICNLFLELVQDMIEISVVVSPKGQNRSLDWSVQFINPKALEDRYVSILMSNSDDSSSLSSKHLEEHLRNRFRGYMHRFKLFNANESPFDLKIELKNNKVQIEEAQ